MALTPEQIAREFHEAYETLAPAFAYSTREESAVPWEQVPEANRTLMIATVRNVLIERHNLLRIAEAAEITNATLQGYANDEHWTIKQLATWDGPVLLREAFAALKAGKSQ